MDYRSTNSRASKKEKLMSQQMGNDEHAFHHLPQLPLNGSHDGGVSSSLGLRSRKDSFENALQNQGNQQKPGRKSRFNQMMANNQQQQMQQPKIKNQILGGGSQRYDAGQPSTVSRQTEAIAHLPKLPYRDSTDASDYQLGGGAIHNEESIMTIPRRIEHAQQAQAQDVRELQPNHSANNKLSHVKSEGAFKTGHGARYDSAHHINGGGRQQQPQLEDELSSPPRKNRLNNQIGGNKHYSSQRRAGGAFDRMSGQTPEISFIDAPPIPYSKRYKADIRNSSATTEQMNISPAKINTSRGQSPDVKAFRMNNRPVQEEKEEYYAMSKKSVDRRDERGGTSAQRAVENGQSALDDQSRDNQSANNGQPRQKSHKMHNEQRKEQVTNESKIRYATPPADLQESSSDKQGVYGPTIEQMQKSLEMKSAPNEQEDQDYNAQPKRKIKVKTMSDSSILKMNAKKLKMSPIAHEEMDENQNFKSHMDFMNQEQIPSSQASSSGKKNKGKGKKIKDTTDKQKDYSRPPIAAHILGGRSSKDTSSDFASRRKSNYLFDVQNKYGASPFNVNAYQDQVTDDYSVKSMSDLCMQIVTQALSKCYNIMPNLACQLIADTRQMINHYRKQVNIDSESSQNKRVILSQHESSIFFNTISDRFYQKAELIIEKSSDLRPVLSMILLGIQSYQSDKTKMDALKCIKFLADINNGHFRGKIWNWIRYTTIKQNRNENEEETLNGDKSQSAATSNRIGSSKIASNVHMVGFIHAINDIMNQVDDSQLNMLACRTLVQIAQKNLKDLFLSQLPTLFSNRVSYLRAVNENFDKYCQAMLEHTDEINRTNLLKQFNSLGVPSFLVAQCLCLIEGNLMQVKEVQLEDFVGLAAANSPSRKHNRVYKRIQDQMQMVVSLLSEIWITWPRLFSSPQQTQMLQNEYEADDFGLKERLNKQSLETGDQKRRLLGNKVLSLFKKVSLGASVTVQLTVISRLFAVLEKLVFEMDDFSDQVYRLLIYLLIEHHHDEIIRPHLMSNFTDLFKQEKVLSLHQMIEPLCSIIESNLGQSSKSTLKFEKMNTYMTMADFSFFWNLANSPRLTIQSAIIICKAMQIFMLKSDSQYRGVAQKIFFRLMGKFSTDNGTQMFLREHADKAVYELDTADQIIKKLSQQNGMNLNNSHNMLSPGSPKSPSGGKSDSFELKLQVHYLFRHLLLLGKASDQQNDLTRYTDSEAQDYKVLKSSPNFHFLCSHIVNSIQKVLKKQPPNQQSKIMVSLLKKLMQPSGAREDEHQDGSQQLDMAQWLRSSGEDMPLSFNLTNAAGVPSKEQMNMLEAKRRLAEQQTLKGVGLAKVQSHETLLSPGKMQEEQNDFQAAWKESMLRPSKVVGMTHEDELCQQAHELLLDQNYSKAEQQFPSPQKQQQLQPYRRNVRDEMTNSSLYEPTMNHVTIVSAEKVFSQVNDAERKRLNTNMSSNNYPPVIAEIAEEQTEESPPHHRQKLQQQQQQQQVPLEPSRREMKEMGTVYDPPVSLTGIQNEYVPQNIEAQKQSQGIQTLPKQVNKKMQVSINQSGLNSNINGTSDIDPSFIKISLAASNSQLQQVEELKSSNNLLDQSRQLQKSRESNISGISEKDGQNKGVTDPTQKQMNQENKTGATQNQIISPIVEEEAEQTDPSGEQSRKASQVFEAADKQYQQINETAQQLSQPQWPLQHRHSQYGEKQGTQNNLHKKYSPAEKKVVPLSTEAMQKVQVEQERLIDLNANSSNKKQQHPDLQQQPPQLQQNLPSLTPQFNDGMQKAAQESLLAPQPMNQSKEVAQSQRVAPDYKQQREQDDEVQIKLPKKQKTDKMEIRKALELINSNLDNLTAELKNNATMTKHGTEEYGTTLRTEIYTTSGGGELPHTSSMVKKPQSPVKVTNQEEPAKAEKELHAVSKLQMPPLNARNEMNIMQTNNSQDVVSRQPNLTKYGSKKQLHDNLENEQGSISANEGRSPHQDRNKAYRLKNFLPSFNNGIDTNKPSMEDYPINASVGSKLAAQEYLTRQRNNNLGSNQHMSEKLIPHYKHGGEKGLFNVMPNSVKHSQMNRHVVMPQTMLDGVSGTGNKSHKILTLNKSSLPDINTSNNNLLSETRAASGLLRSNRASQERPFNQPVPAIMKSKPLASVGNHLLNSTQSGGVVALNANTSNNNLFDPGTLSVHTKGPLPRNQHFGQGAVPISLPKMSDFWRGNPVGHTQYGDGINFQTHGRDVSPRANVNQQPIQRYHTAMTQEEDIEMSEQFSRHNKRLMDKQKQFMKQHNKGNNDHRGAQPNRSVTQQTNLDNHYGGVENRSAMNQMNDMNRGMKKTGYSCFSGNTQLEGYKQLSNPRRGIDARSMNNNKKQEVQRLENALERLLVNLGTDQDQQLDYPQLMPDDEYFIRDDHPTKSNQEGNKLANTMSSGLDQDREIDSYIKTDRGMGVASGPASPVHMELQNDEEIDIVKPPTYDPTHPGLANLSPDQLAALKKLAHMNDNDIPMNENQLKELENLLDLIENGVPIDGNHPGMANLTPKLQQPQFLNLLQGDKKNKLTPSQMNDLDKLKNLVVHGIPLNSSHPGVVNLSPDQKKDLVAMEQKQKRGQPLRSAEDDKLGDYKETIANGIPVDSNHPGVVNLTEHQKDKLKDLEGKDPKFMSPDDKNVHDGLKNEIVHGRPLDKTHPGFSNLTPLDAKFFDALQNQKQRDGGSFNDPEKKNSLNNLQEMIKGADPIDETHPGFRDNLTPLQQDAFKELHKAKDQLQPDANKKYDTLRNQIANGQPLDVNHPGMSHLTPRQQLNLKGMLRRRNNGDTLPNDDVKTLQNIQNLMVNGKPLNARHPGYKKLRPKQRDVFDELADKHKKSDGRGLKPEDANKLEKLAGAIQLGSGPFDLDHEGVHNLVPQEETVLKDILDKQADGEPLTKDDQDGLKFLKDTMRPAIPYDKLHPNFDQLTAPDQQKLLDFNKRLDAGQILPPKDEAEHQKIKDSMNDPTPIDENHPGWKNLIAPEKDKFKELRAKEDDGDLDSDEEQEFQGLKDIIINGRPIDEKHPGFDNLNPNMQKRLKDQNKKKRNGQELTPEESKDHAKLCDIVMNGDPINEQHPGFKGLDPHQKKRFSKLKKQRDDGDPLQPAQKKELDQLRTDIFPEEFTPPMNTALNNLLKKDREGNELDPEEQDRKGRLVELKNSLPHQKPPQDGLTDDERALLGKYLAMRVFEEPMTAEQLDEMNDLLRKEKDHEREITPDESSRMRELVRILYKTFGLEPDEEIELAHLHEKQNRGIGSLTPNQANILRGLDDHLNAGQPFNDKMQQHYDFLRKLQSMPSQLNPVQEEELQDMEERNKQDDIPGPMKKRLQAFWKMRYHPQMFNLEDRALFYAMKDLEALPRLQPQQEDMLFALQKRFNCLPYITPEQINMLEFLNEELYNGRPLSPQQHRDLNKLEQLPRPEKQVSEFPGLTPPESKEYKKLKAKRDNGDKMTPAELQRYRDLKDKIKEAEKELNALRTPPQRPENMGSIPREHSAVSRQKSIIKTPDNMSKRPQRQVTYAPLPSELQHGESLMLPSMGASGHSPFNHQSTLGRGDGDRDISPGTAKQERRAAQQAFKKALKRGNCTLKELINQFYTIEKRYMLNDFRNGLRTHYEFATAVSGLSKPLTLKDFLRYAADKKIKYKQHQVIEILRDDCRQDNITYESFLKLLILASCGGDRTKIGISNYKKLMSHMDITK